MSDTDSFIDEVTEEVRRDRLFGYLRRYGWIAVVADLALVGGAAWNEYTKAQAVSQAQAFGDAILAALEAEDRDARIAELQAIEGGSTQAQAILGMLIAAEQSAAQDDGAAAQTLRDAASSPDVPEIYRQIAAFKALTRAGSSMDADQRRLELETLATPGTPLRLLAEEQLALMDIEMGETDAALARLQSILQDAEATTGLRRRASQLIVALGGTPDAA